MKDIFERKVDYIGLDYDDLDIQKFLFNYFRIKKEFPKAKIETELSSSTRGLHIIIHQKCTIKENFRYRVMFNDDIVRLGLSLSKLLMNPEEKYVDLIFDSKGGKEVTKLNMKELLKNDKELVALIEKNIEKEDVWDYLEKLATSIQHELPTKELWTTCIQFKGDTLKQKLRKVCEDITNKDPTFQWRIWINYQAKTMDYVLIVFSGNKDQAHKRGMWITKKSIPEEELLYFVKPVRT